MGFDRGSSETHFHYVAGGKGWQARMKYAMQQRSYSTICGVAVWGK